MKPLFFDDALMGRCEQWDANNWHGTRKRPFEQFESAPIIKGGRNWMPRVYADSKIKAGNWASGAFQSLKLQTNAQTQKEANKDLLSLTFSNI